MIDNIEKAIYSKDTCALGRMLSECNDILTNPIAGSFAKKRAWSLKMEILRKTTPYIELE